MGKKKFRGLEERRQLKNFLKKSVHVLAKIMLLVLLHRVLGSKALRGSEGEAGKERVRESIVRRFGLQSSLELEQVWSHTETKKGRGEEKVFKL